MIGGDADDHAGARFSPVHLAAGIGIASSIPVMREFLNTEM